MVFFLFVIELDVDLIVELARNRTALQGLYGMSFEWGFSSPIQSPTSLPHAPQQGSRVMAWKLLLLQFVLWRFEVREQDLGTATFITWHHLSHQPSAQVGPMVQWGFSSDSLSKPYDHSTIPSNYSAVQHPSVRPPPYAGLPVLRSFCWVHALTQLLSVPSLASRLTSTYSVLNPNMLF